MGQLKESETRDRLLSQKLNVVNMKLEDLERTAQKYEEDASRSQAETQRKMSRLEDQIAALQGGARPKILVSKVHSRPAQEMQTLLSTEINQPTAEITSGHIALGATPPLPKPAQPEIAWSTVAKKGLMACTSKITKADDNAFPLNTHPSIGNIPTTNQDDSGCMTMNSVKQRQSHRKPTNPLISALGKRPSVVCDRPPRNKGRPDTVIGNRPINQSLLKPATGNSLNTFILGNCAETTTVADVTKILAERNISPFSLYDLKARTGGRRRFLIKTIANSSIMDPETWPIGTHCSQRSHTNNSPNSKIWGTNEEARHLHISGQPFSKIYIGGCDPSTTENDVLAHISLLSVGADDIKNVSFFKLDKTGLFKSFVIEASRRLDDILLSQDSWPRGIRFWRLRHRQSATEISAQTPGESAVL